jgi:cytochrome c peroxidase
MNLALKLISVAAAIVAGVPTAFAQGVRATPVDPAVVDDVEETPRARNRSGNANSRGLIERGRQLFMTETFDGNGRTCASCHPPTNNFTIDPGFIATLPDDDPLFVAEFNPDLAGLEDPEMLRDFGLILENADGLDKPGVFRGVPHTLGLRVSTAVNPDGDEDLIRADGSTVRDATGWSGDGAPGDGSLRSFAIGAVVQHFPKTMNRVEGQDFRLPTAAELDALEAFQLSLGRQREIDLATMNFADPDVQTGKDLFDGVGINRGCSFCHRNAGANDADGFNRNFATNAANLTNMEARRSHPGMPGDGGFGQEPEFEVPGITATFHGNGSMNTPPLVEAADTGPFFHNNSAKTIEDAVRFYTTRTFSSDDPFQLSGAQVSQLAAFLRALNALENVRNVDLLAGDAQRQQQGPARQTIEVVIADTEDAIEVLAGGALDLHPDAVQLLDEALGLAEDARDTDQAAMRNTLLGQIRDLMQAIPDLILQAPPEAEVADGDAAPPAEGDAAPPSEDQGEAEGRAAPPPEEQADADGDAAPPPEEQADADGDAAPPSKDQVNADDDAAPPPEEQADADGDAAPPSKDQVNADGDAAPSPEDQANADGDAAPSSENRANTDGDAAPPPEDKANTDGDAAPPPEDQANADGDAGPSSEDQANAHGDAAPPSKDQADAAHGDAAPPSKDQADAADGDAAPPSKDQADADGDAAPPSKDQADAADGDAAPPPQDAAAEGRDAAPPSDDTAQGDGDSVAPPTKDSAESAGDQPRESEEERHLAAAS